MKILRQYIGYLIAGILLYFLIKPFLQTHTAVEDATYEIHWGWLLCSFGTILFYWSAYLYPFVTLLRGFTGCRVSFRDAFTLFHLANITRYLPGRIWGVVRLLSLSRRFGLSKTAVGSSLTGHVGIETAIGGLIALSLLFSKQMQGTAIEVLEKMQGQTLLWALAVMVLLAGGLFLIPKLADPRPAVSQNSRSALRRCERFGERCYLPRSTLALSRIRLFSVCPKFRSCAVGRRGRSHGVLRVCVDCRFFEFPDTRGVRDT